MAKLVSRLRVIAEGADEALSLALHDTANFILVLIRANAPVETGFLRDSYQKESLSLLHILIGTMVNYSIFQEYGTSRQAGTPHVTPAFVMGKTILQESFNARMRSLG
jgi:HK97 gp10 family phage protein